MKKPATAGPNAATPALSNIEKSLGIVGLHEFWRERWKESQATFPGRGMLLFDDAFIRGANGLMRLPEEAFGQLQQALFVVRSREDICRLLWHAHHLLFVAPTPAKTAEIIIEKWPALPALGNLTGMAGLIAFLQALPRAREFYRDKGIPESVLQETFTDIMIWMRHYYQKHGVWGLGEISWLVHHFNCNVFSVGRLQYTNTTTGKVATLSGGGDKFRGDGLLDGTNGAHDPVGAWVSRFTADRQSVTGNPILPEGKAVNRVVTLSLQEWELKLQGGDIILEVHVPEGRKMPLDECRQSYHDALVFFARYFPDLPAKAFATHTWLFDPQLHHLLTVEKSNILQFQLGYHLAPLLGDDSQAIERVYGFGLKTADVPVARRDTTLRRTMAEFVMQGNRMRATAGFMLLDDVDRKPGFYRDNCGI